MQVQDCIYEYYEWIYIWRLIQWKSAHFFAVTQAAIPNTPSNKFQEATRHYNTRIEKYTGYRYTAGLHTSIWHILILPLTFASYTYYRESQLEFFNLHWRDCPGFSGTSLAQQKECILHPAVLSSKMQASSFLPEQLAAKSHRPSVYLEPSIHICGKTLKNAQVSQPYVLQAI